MTIFLFLDETGNLDFSSNGTEFYGFGCLATRSPGSLLAPLSALRYELLEAGLEIERFHATEDKQPIRNRVFEILRVVDGLEFDSIIIDKRRVPPRFYPVEKFYVYFVGYLIDLVLKRFSGSERIVLITDKIPVAKKREAVAKAFKQYVRTALGDRPFTVVHQSSSAHMCLQAADYFMWAIYKKWSNGEMRPYTTIQSMIRGESRIYDSPDSEEFY